jgi:hypothetical protein
MKRQCPAAAERAQDCAAAAAAVKPDDKNQTRLGFGRQRSRTVGCKQGTPPFPEPPVILGVKHALDHTDNVGLAHLRPDLSGDVRSVHMQDTPHPHDLIFGT